MNLIFITWISYIALFHLCTAQDYASTYNPDPTLTKDFNDPNRRLQDRNQYENRNQYDPNQRYSPDRNDPYGRNEFGTDNQRPTWERGPSYGGSFKTPALEHENLIINEATYFIVASKIVRPGQIYKISASILKARLQMTIRASISRDGVEIADILQRVKEGVPEILNMRIPVNSVPGDYKLRVEGLYMDTPFGGRAFHNETQLVFSRRFMTIFIQMDKPVYMQGQTVRFRAIPINTELKAFGRAIDVFILDPNRRIMKRWLSRQSNFGTVSLQYQISDQPLFGEWHIRVEALGQVEETTFLVEEYYQTRFEVNVTMPAFFFNTEPYIHGRVMANYTSGAPVRGNLTLRATVRPIPHYRPEYYHQGQYNNQGHYGVQPGYSSQYGRTRQNANPYLYNESSAQYEQFRPGQPSRLDQPGWWYDAQAVRTRLFNFDEKYPFWMPKPDPNQYLNQYGQTPADTNYNTYSTTGYSGSSYSEYYSYNLNQLPYLRYFNGTYDFKYPMSELAQLVPVLDGVEVIITASVGDPFLDEVVEGYSIARIHNSSLAVTFLGGTPQVFKPHMPFDIYMAVSYHDGSPLAAQRARAVSLSLSAQPEGRGAVLQHAAAPALVPGHAAIWHVKLDLYTLMNLERDANYRETLSGVTGVRLNAQLTDGSGGRASADMRLVAHHSPTNQHIRVATSTTDAKVGEYVIFHVQSNFYMESFNYVVLSKGIILTSAQEIMPEGVRTFAVTVSAEMAPVSTIVVWCTERRGHVLADSLTFPVNGISRNNFTVFINNRKHRTGERVEVSIYGEPGAYVGLSGIDNAFYTMQAGNELTYAKVISKMSYFDEATNGTFAYTWRSHLGDADELVYFPSSTYGIDANRTFEYAGLVVFSDVEVSRRPSNCNATAGFLECLEGGACYTHEQRCDGNADCIDRTDEANCEHDSTFELSHFRKFRFNRVQRQYDNAWLWRDVNVGPHGRYVFTVDVPQVPAQWTVSAFSMSPTLGVGMLHTPIRYVGVLPFFIKVEGPDRCRQGEQIGIRVVVFNYQPQAIEAVVVLEASPEYKFIHVEENGIVVSYNPRTSFGEQQFFVYIAAGDAATVHVPVVSTRLGDIRVRLHAATLQGKHRAIKKITVEADGLPQHRHQSVLLDLSSRAYVFQYMHVNVTETPLIPYEVDRYYVLGSNRARVSVVGDVVGPLFPTMPVNASSLLDLPMDSAEQNMFSFALNMYHTLYMRLINQRNRTLEKEAFYHMNILYQRQLSFMKPDGSFSTFRSDWNQSASSVWLTSFCAKILQDASFNEWENFIYIDPNVISQAVSWVLQHQTPQGAFYEPQWSPDRSANDTLSVPRAHALYRDSLAMGASIVNGYAVMTRNITLTAQVVITLETVKNLKDIDLREGLSAHVAIAQQRAIGYLERNLQMLFDFGEPYPLAVVAYALTFSKAPSSEHAYRLLKQKQRSEGGLEYWGKEPVPQPPYKTENQKPFLLPRLPYKYDSNNIAATAYALLACMDHQDNNEAVVMWLNSQRLRDGGWESTQDTYIATRALIEYTNRKRLRDVSTLTVTIDAVALKGASRVLHLENNNMATVQSIDIPEAWGTVKVEARGAGYAILQLSVQYNVDIARFQTQPPLPAFSLLAQPLRYYGRNQSHIEFQSCASWTLVEESPRSGLAVMDIAIPTGYMVQQQRLDAYVLSRRVPTLQRAKYLPAKILFYFDYLSAEQTCVNFTIERWFPVANMSRYLPVRVYDYYAPERYNETIFDALPTYLLNICEVCGSSQCPYCAIYNAAFKSTVAFPALLIAVMVSLVRYYRPTIDVEVVT